jgi:hypothetical protein
MLLDRTSRDLNLSLSLRPLSLRLMLRKVVASVTSHDASMLGRYLSELELELGRRP